MAKPNLQQPFMNYDIPNFAQWLQFTLCHCATPAPSTSRIWIMIFQTLRASRRTQRVSAPSNGRHPMTCLKEWDYDSNYIYGFLKGFCIDLRRPNNTKDAAMWNVFINIIYNLCKNKSSIKLGSTFFHCNIAIFSFAIKNVRIWHFCNCEEPISQSGKSRNCELWNTKCSVYTQHEVKIRMKNHS